MTEPCAIWKSKTYESTSAGDKVWYDSPRAGGGYEITRTAAAMVEHLTPLQKALLTTWLGNQRMAGSDCPLITSEEITRAKSARPLSVRERRDRLLQAVAFHAPRLGQTMRYSEMTFIAGGPPVENPHWANLDILKAVTESLIVEEVEKLIAFAQHQGLLVNSGGLALTFDGYSHLEQISANQTVATQAFVAMWFGEEVRTAYDNGIAPAIKDAGYEAFRIDRKEHNNKIDDEIIAEIRRSRFVVADFTCGIVGAGEEVTAIPRGGVYYEAGFAQGLGIPVIWMCRADHIDLVHFDTRQFNHITWSSPQELRERLRARIGAVLGDGPLIA